MTAYRTILTCHVCCLLACLLALNACSGEPAIGQSPGPAAIEGALPPLPAGKVPTEVSGYTIEGDAAFSMSLNAAAADTDMELQSSTGNLSWGIWRLQPGEHELLGVEVLLSAPQGSSAYVAISNYADGRWDIDGPLTAGKEFNLDDVANRSGDGNCFVAVITSNGDQATVNRLVMTVNRVGWQVVTVDSTGFSGKQSSLAVIDGHPAISYYDDSAAQALKFVRSATTTGADPEDWSDPAIVKTGWIAYSDLAEVEGHPAICFWLQGSFAYARSTSAEGTNPGDWIVVGIDSQDNAGHYCSMTVVDGNPAVSYMNNPDVNVANLRYARSSTTTGDGIGDWTQKVLVDTGGEVGSYTSLAVVDGNPAISYYDKTDSQLKFARATTSTGADQADWSQIVVVDAVEYGSAFTSLAIVDGNPAISYWDSKNDDLKFARSLTATGADAGDWLQNAIVHADAQPLSTDLFTSLAVINGSPAIAYPFKDGGTHLGYAAATTSTGGDSADWSIKHIVDGDSGVGTNCAMTVVGGRPAISYFDETNYDLKYAILFE